MLETKVFSLHRRMENTPGDGNCLLHSVTDQLLCITLQDHIIVIISCSDSSYANTLGPSYNEKKYAVILSDFIYLVIVTEQITYIEDTCYQAFYLLICYNRVRVTRARVYMYMQQHKDKI